MPPLPWNPLVPSSSLPATSCSFPTSPEISFISAFSTLYSFSWTSWFFFCAHRYRLSYFRFQCFMSACWDAIILTLHLNCLPLFICTTSWWLNPRDRWQPILKPVYLDYWFSLSVCALCRRIRILFDACCGYAALVFHYYMILLVVIQMRMMVNSFNQGGRKVHSELRILLLRLPSSRCRGSLVSPRQFPKNSSISKNSSYHPFHSQPSTSMCLAQFYSCLRTLIHRRLQSKS